MVDIESYIARLTDLLRARFGERLRYVGLQGSYLRGEADESSDIDIMAVIDGLGVADLDGYRADISSLEAVDRSCGFICGTEELRHWNPLEICHVLHSTRDFYGELEPLLPGYSETDVRNFVKLSVNNLYHELCHRYVHADREANAAGLPASYKGVFFILQNLHFLRTGDFIATKRELEPLLPAADRAVLTRSLELRSGGEYDFEDSFRLLLDWCRDTVKSL